MAGAAAVVRAVASCKGSAEKRVRTDHENAPGLDSAKHHAYLHGKACAFNGRA